MQAGKASLQNVQKAAYAWVLVHGEHLHSSTPYIDWLAWDYDALEVLQNVMKSFPILGGLAWQCGRQISQLHATRPFIAQLESLPSTISSFWLWKRNQLQGEHP